MWSIINSHRGNCNKYESLHSRNSEIFISFFLNIPENLMKNIPDKQIDPLERLESLIGSQEQFSFGEVSYNFVRKIIDNLKN